MMVLKIKVMNDKRDDVKIFIVDFIANKCFKGQKISRSDLPDFPIP